MKPLTISSKRTTIACVRNQELSCTFKSQSIDLGKGKRDYFGALEAFDTADMNCRSKSVKCMVYQGHSTRSHLPSLYVKGEGSIFVMVHLPSLYVLLTHAH